MIQAFQCWISPFIGPTWSFCIRGRFVGENGAGSATAGGGVWFLRIFALQRWHFFGFSSFAFLDRVIPDALGAQMGRYGWRVGGKILRPRFRGRNPSCCLQGLGAQFCRVVPAPCRPGRAGERKAELLSKPHSLSVGIDSQGVTNVAMDSCRVSLAHILEGFKQPCMGGDGLRGQGKDLEAVAVEGDEVFADETLSLDDPGVLPVPLRALSSVPLAHARRIATGLLALLDSGIRTEPAPADTAGTFSVGRDLIHRCLSASCRTTTTTLCHLHLSARVQCNRLRGELHRWEYCKSDIVWVRYPAPH